MMPCAIIGASSGSPRLKRSSNKISICSWLINSPSISRSSRSRARPSGIGLLPAKTLLSPRSELSAKGWLSARHSRR
jgi:hypothetical protein